MMVNQLLTIHECTMLTNNCPIHLFFLQSTSLLAMSSQFTLRLRARGQVELCVIIFEPDTGAPRPFDLSFTTENSSAGQLVIHCS